MLKLVSETGKDNMSNKILHDKEKEKKNTSVMFLGMYYSLHSVSGNILIK